LAVKPFISNEVVSASAANVIVASQALEQVDAFIADKDIVKIRACQPLYSKQ
jgi:hypothetical protein